MRNRRAAVITLAAALAILASGGRVMAVSTNWDNDFPGDWFNGDNWTAGVPNGGVDAVVTRQDSLGAPIPSAQISVPLAETLNVILGQDPASMPNNTRYVGGLEIVGTGGLNILQNLRLGTTTGMPGGVPPGPGKVDYGEVRVMGEDTGLIVGWDASVGEYGEGLIELAAGAYMTARNVGVGQEYVTLASGMPASKGTLNLSTGAVLDAVYLGVGMGGVGTMSITSGAQVHCTGGGSIAGLPPGGGPSRSSGSSATISGADSRWDLGSGLSVGSSNPATLTIQSGGRVSSSIGYIGNADLGGTGTVSVSGSNSAWSISSYLDFDAGTLTISGGKVSIGTDAYLALGTTTTLNGGTLEAQTIAARHEGASATTNYDSGTLRVGTHVGPLVNKGCTLDPKGYLTEVRWYASEDYYDYDQWAAATLWIDVDGSPASGNYDKLSARDIDLAGTLKLDFTSFVPQSGSIYPFLFVQPGFNISGLCTVQTIGLPGQYWVNVDWAAGEFTVMVPEPNTAMAILLGLATLGLLRRRRAP